MIHLDLRYTYNLYFDCPILVYKLIISLRKAFQGPTHKRYFCLLLEMLKLREQQCSHDVEMFFGVFKKLSIYVSVWTMILLVWHLINLRLFVIDLHHYSDRAAALNDLCHTNVLGIVVHIKVTKDAVEFLKARRISALFFRSLNQITRQNVLLQLMQT